MKTMHKSLYFTEILLLFYYTEFLLLYGNPYTIQRARPGLGPVPQSSLGAGPTRLGPGPAWIRGSKNTRRTYKILSKNSRTDER